MIVLAMGVRCTPQCLGDEPLHRGVLAIAMSEQRQMNLDLRKPVRRWMSMNTLHVILDKLQAL